MLPDNAKKILLITYHFPPSTAIGGMRIASFAKYLPAEGWEPHVLTLKDRYLEQKDIKRLESLRDIPIVKAGRLLTMRDIYLKLKIVLKKWSTGSRIKASRVSASQEAIALNKKSRKNKIKHFIASLVVLPDEERNWILPAVIQAIRIMRREKINYILTSCPPYSVHLVGLLVTILRPGTTWIADFRDPWMVPTEKATSPTTSFSNAIDYRLEKFVMQRADLVLTTTPNLANKFIDFFSQCLAGKFKLVPNGFDAEVTSIDEPQYDIFTISYTGILYVGRSPEPVFQAVSSLIRQKKITPAEIRIKLVGHCRDVEGVATSEIVVQYGLESVVEVIEPVPQEEARKIIKKSHVALLLAPDQSYQIPAKTYEYIGLGTPILAISGEGATADLVNSVSTGKAVLAEDVAAIEEYILEMIKKQNSQEMDGVTGCEQYTRQSSVKILARYLRGLH